MIFIRRIVGVSMEPLLRPGQLVVCSSLTKASVGTIVVFEHEGRQKIKSLQSIHLQSLYVVGLNEDNQSTDSRQFGYIPAASVKGIVVWPLRCLHRSVKFP